DSSASQSGIDFDSTPGGPVEINLADSSASQSGSDFDSTPGSPMEINLEDSSASQSGIDYDSTPGPMEINLEDSSASRSGSDLGPMTDSQPEISFADVSAGSHPEIHLTDDQAIPLGLDLGDESEEALELQLSDEIPDAAPQAVASGDTGASFNDSAVAFPVADGQREQTGGQPSPVNIPEDIDSMPFDVGSHEADAPPAQPNVKTTEFEAVKEEQAGQSPLAIERSISEETHTAQDMFDSKSSIDVGTEIAEKPKEKSHTDEVEFEIEFEDSEKADELPPMEVDSSQLIQSPSFDPEHSGIVDSHELSGVDELDLSSVIMEDSSSGEIDSPFQEISGTDMAFDSHEDLLTEDVLFLDEDYFETEQVVAEELETIAFWLKEVEKQRTSTIEKNMMEIFDEFKKGVDEKIGQEDYDTRYNLGIAYKEMGLLEEAIHEFLISAKHTLKFFDSAGLLGMCFREKGMFSEAVGWFEKALETPDRKQDEYLAVRFELVQTFKLDNDLEAAMKHAGDIIKIDPSYRSITDIYEELKKDASG
ncbi:MAG: tetratricopeptide repeat protein, partial [bacterium]|nr:tetratricopeptide repeat protein [bacterium]